VILGCDPGLTGALVYYDGWEPFIVDMPTRQTIVSRKIRNVIDEARVLEEVRRAVLFGAEILVIEQVGGMPSQSGPAAFTFGYGVGVVTVAALAAGLQIERVHPAQWKAALGLKTSEKGAARALAAQTFPRSAHLFSRAKDNGRAEAALIAHYGWLTRGKSDAC
jgi:crossover junction endodeoxyribonuclease RuvC